MIRFGLCCIFTGENIKFRHLTALSLRKYDRAKQLPIISGICLHNSESLLSALETVQRLGIGAFRINSQLFPLYTHPEVGYKLEDLPDSLKIKGLFKKTRMFRDKNNIRLSFHPDQFIILASPNEKVVMNSVEELEYHAKVAGMCGADVINIHVGGTYGNKAETLKRFAENFRKLTQPVAKLITLENDDKQYTPSDLLPFCRENKIPMVYDVHHHRCNPDDLTIGEATNETLKLWKDLGREAYFHISSPKHGWGSKNPSPHADYIDPADFPECWRNLNATIDVEAKAKELAVLKLMMAFAHSPSKNHDSPQSDRVSGGGTQIKSQFSHKTAQDSQKNKF